MIPPNPLVGGQACRQDSAPERGLPFPQNWLCLCLYNSKLTRSDFVKRLKPMSPPCLDAFGSGHACARPETRLSRQGIGAVM